MAIQGSVIRCLNITFIIVNTEYWNIPVQFIIHVSCTFYIQLNHINWRKLFIIVTLYVTMLQYEFMNSLIFCIVVFCIKIMN